MEDDVKRNLWIANLTWITSSVVKSLAPCLVAAVLTLVTVSVSSAIDLTTATLLVKGGGELAQCSATNGGKKPVDVTVEILDAQTGESLEDPRSCTLESLRACIQTFFNADGLDNFVVCRISASGRVRGVLAVQSGTGSEAR